MEKGAWKLGRPQKERWKLEARAEQWRSIGRVWDNLAVAGMLGIATFTWQITTSIWKLLKAEQFDYRMLWKYYELQWDAVLFLIAMVLLSLYLGRASRVTAFKIKERVKCMCSR